MWTWSGRDNQDQNNKRLQPGSATHKPTHQHETHCHDRPRAGVKGHHLVLCKKKRGRSLNPLFLLGGFPGIPWRVGWLVACSGTCSSTGHFVIPSNWKVITCLCPHRKIFLTYYFFPFWCVEQLLQRVFFFVKFAIKSCIKGLGSVRFFNVFERKLLFSQDCIYSIKIW